MYTPNIDENKRLKLQNQILDGFDCEVYKEVLEKYTSFTFLDIGCGSGAMIIPKISKYNCNQFVGVDKSDLQITRANKKFSNGNIHFVCLDLESDLFETNFDSYLKSINKNQFDIINLSMTLLHLKHPYNVLKILHKYLKEDGSIIVRDIDDGLNFASPDEEKLFEKIYQIASEDDISGNRYMGRDVYPCLVKAGYSNIELKKEGLSTSGMNSELKSAFYEMSFKAMMDRTAIMLNNHPNVKKYLDNYNWVLANEDKVTSLFFEEEFIASLGFVSFVARK